jgi:glycolate dehydrogenase iron-sulfur subunit
MEPIEHVASEQRLLECVHCGLCLNSCPTYLELGTEMDSPRGRIHLIRGLQEGKLWLNDDVVRHLDLCLGCRACETACPSGVRYGAILEEARAYVESKHRRAWWDRLRRQLITATFPHPKRLRRLLGLVEPLRRIGVWGAVRRLVPGADLLPEVISAGELPVLTQAEGEIRARVALLAGCVGGELFSGVNRATLRVLARNGISTVVPQAQVCCGALHLHGGDPQAARVLARRNLEAFPDDVDAIVVNAAGCGTAMKEYGELLAEGPLAERAKRFANKVRDVSELLVEMGLRSPHREVRERVTYHDACHLAHGQGVRQPPRALLAAIPGLVLIDLPESEVCCGSAGSYNLTEPRLATRLRERKVDHITATGATCVAAGNPGCLLQIRAGLRARGVDVRVAHPVELLDEAYGGDTLIP